MSEYDEEMDRLEAKRDFSRREREKRELEQRERERMRRESQERERRLRERYAMLKRNGILVPPYEEWKRRLI